MLLRSHAQHISIHLNEYNYAGNFFLFFLNIYTHVGRPGEPHQQQSLIFEVVDHVIDSRFNNESGE